MKHILIFYFSTLPKSQDIISQGIKPADFPIGWHDSGIFQRVNLYFGNATYFNHIFLSVPQCYGEEHHSFLGTLTVLSKPEEMLLTTANPVVRKSKSKKGDHLTKVILPLLASSTSPLK